MIYIMINVMVIRKKEWGEVATVKFHETIFGSYTCMHPCSPPPSPALCSELPSASKYINSILSV